MAQAQNVDTATENLARYQTEHPGYEFRITRVGPHYEIAQLLRCIDCSADVESLVFGDTTHVRCHDCGRAFLARLDEQARERAAETREEIEFADRYMRDGGRGWGAD